MDHEQPPNQPIGTPAKDRVGAVIIGRNEGERLVRALHAALPHVARVVYVDSNSTDTSVENAREIGVHTIALKDGPFTAARGRQTGLDALLANLPTLEFIQFIDGDCVMDPGWIDAGVEFLDENPKVAAVSGRWREEFPERTIYNRLTNVDWHAEPGPAPYPGGNSLCRVAALRDIGGWRTDLIAGEDPDLGFRLTEHGWFSHRLAHEMVLHDINMRSFRAFWKREQRSGYCYAQVGWMHRQGPGKPWVKRAASALLYGLLLPILILTMAIVFWPVAIVLSLLYARVWWSLYRRAKRLDEGVAERYASLILLCKVSQALGVLRSIGDGLFRRDRRLIEYKGATAKGPPEQQPTSHGAG